MANTMKALQTVTVGAGGAATVTFSSIPQTYTDLVILSNARTNRSDTQDPIKLNFNGDTGSNYPYRYLLGNNTGVSSGSGTAAFAIAGIATAANATASTFGNDMCYIPNYVGSNQKSMSIDSVTENNAADATTRLDAFLWTGTAPITSIVLAPTAGTLINQYSTFTLYGVFNQDVIAAPAAPTIGTASDGGTGDSASVAFTGVSGAASYTATSSPGGFTGTAAASPVTVTGLTAGTAYTFTVKANNPIGTGPASAASNSVTPVVPGAFESIASATGSGQSSVTFSSIPSTYKHLQIRVFARNTDTGSGGTNRINLTWNGNGSGYARHYLTGNGSTVSADAGNGNSFVLLMGSMAGDATTADCFDISIVDILDYASTSKTKVIQYVSGGEFNSTAGALFIGSGMLDNTGAITSINLASNSGGFKTGSVVALYGIKG